MNDSVYYKRLILKSNKSPKEWELLKEFCQKNNQISLFEELYDFQVNKKKDSCKTSSFWENLGVSVFQTVNYSNPDKELVDVTGFILRGGRKI